MPNLALISHDLFPCVQRAVIVLSEKPIPDDRCYINLADKPDWFHEISPLGKVTITNSWRHGNLQIRGHLQKFGRDHARLPVSGRSATKGAASRFDQVSLYHPQ